MPAALVSKKGFSLVELLVFIAVFLSVFTIILGIISYSSLSIKNSEYQTFASHYADELVQWLRYQRDEQGYNALDAKASAGGSVYCFNSSPISWPAIVGECGAQSYTLGDFYKRELSLVWVDADQVVADITVEWEYLGSTRTTAVQFYLTNRE